MLTVLIFTILVLLAFSITSNEPKEAKVFGCCVACVFSLLFGCMVADIGTDFFGVEVSRTQCHRDIVSIRNDSVSQGHFRMLHSHEYYYMYGKTQRGGYEQVRISTRDAEIMQTNEEAPKIRWDVITYRPSRWFHIWPAYRSERNSSYLIIVPTNTIIEQFKLQ